MKICFKKKKIIKKLGKQKQNDQKKKKILTAEVEP